MARIAPDVHPWSWSGSYTPDEHGRIRDLVVGHDGDERTSGDDAEQHEPGMTSWYASWV